MVARAWAKAEVRRWLRRDRHGESLRRRGRRAAPGADLHRRAAAVQGSPEPRPRFGLGWAAILRHRSEEEKQRWGKPIHSGEAFWRQLFSEPAAGSVLARLRTRAVKRGDKSIVNGQKIWSSEADHADHGILIARSDPRAPKHKGLTFFVLDMPQSGVTVRPIRQITGHSDCNETFIAAAVIDERDRLGAEVEGWAVAMT